MTAYEASILRYCPDSFSAEFANVALIMIIRDDGGAISDIYFKFEASKGRYKDFFRNCFDSDSYSLWRADIVRRVKKSISRYTKSLITPGETFADILVSIYRPGAGAFTWSDSTIGVSMDCKAEFDKLYTRFIRYHWPKQRAHALSDEEFWDEQQPEIEHHLHSLLNRNIIQFNYQVSGPRREVFHMHWKNGVEQFLEPLSLAGKDTDYMKDKSDKLAGRLYYLHKNMANFKCTILVAPPRDPNHQTIYARRISDLRDACNVRDVIEKHQLPSFLQQVALEAK